MCETAKERVKLLRKGFSQKQIETLYIEEKNFKIVNPHIVIELVEIDDGIIKKHWMNCKAAAEYARS